MNIANKGTSIIIRTDDEACDYCGKTFVKGEVVFVIADPLTEDAIYFCADRQACMARERSNNE